MRELRSFKLRITWWCARSSAPSSSGSLVALAHEFQPKVRSRRIGHSDIRGCSNAQSTDSRTVRWEKTSPGGTARVAIIVAFPVEPKISFGTPGTRPRALTMCVKSCTPSGANICTSASLVDLGGAAPGACAIAALIAAHLSLES